MGLYLTLFRESCICRERDLDKIAPLFRELTSPREREQYLVLTLFRD